MVLVARAVLVAPTYVLQTHGFDGPLHSEDLEGPDLDLDDHTDHVATGVCFGLF